MIIKVASVNDAESILELQRLCYVSEASIYNDFSIPPLTQSLESMKKDFGRQVVLKAVEGYLIVGSVRGYSENGTCKIGRLIVHPTFQNQGIGRNLMNAIEAKFSEVGRFELFTGEKSTKNLSLYRKLGYVKFGTEQMTPSVRIVYMEKYAPGHSN